MVKVKFDENGIRITISFAAYVIACIVMLVLWQFVFMGHWFTETLQPYYVNETNPVTRIDMIESYNSVTGTVTSIDNMYADRWSVSISVDEKYDLDEVTVYLFKADIKKLHVGDTITVRGTIEVTDKEGRKIGIGCKYDILPFFIFKAKLLSVN